MINREGGLVKETCKAAVLYGPGDLRIEEVPVPEVGPGDVLVRVKSCSLCGSDLHAYVTKHPRVTFPRILGHEFSGTIFKKGEAVSDWKIGDRVCCGVNIACDECAPCLEGQKHLCLNLKGIGFDLDGAYSEFVKVPQNNLFHLPDAISLDEASMIQTLTVGYNAVKLRGEVTLQDRVLIFGAGPIGLCVLASTIASGAKTYVVDTLDYRLEIAKTMGGEETLNPAQGDLVKKVLDLTGGKGVDKVFEAVGGEQDITLTQATRVVKRGGMVVVLGTFSGNRATLPITDFKNWALDLRGGGKTHPDIWPDCIDLVASGRVRLEKMISHQLKLDDVEKGLKLMHEKGDRVLKVIIHP